jgi:hypothetical protein
MVRFWKTVSKKKEEQQGNAASSVEKRILKELVYRHYLTFEQLENSDIPDSNLRVISLGGFYKNDSGHTFIFSPRKDDSPWLSNYIRIIGESEKLVEMKWDKNFEELEKITLGMRKIVKGEIEGLYSEENRSPSCFQKSCYIRKPEIEMTQKRMARLGSRLAEEIGFKTLGIISVNYENVVPKDPAANDLGFNLPSNAIVARIWRQ